MFHCPRRNTALVNNANAVESAPPLAATQIVAPRGIAFNAFVNTAAHLWREAFNKASASGGNSVCCARVTLAMLVEHLTQPRALIFACQRLPLANARFLFWALAVLTQDAPDFSPHDWRQFPRPNHRRD